MSTPPDQGHRLVLEPTTGRPVLLAPQRHERPFLTSAAGTAACPFCPGHETATPPEVFALRTPATAPDTPGWTVRVVPNKYPANDHHEVIVESDRHVEQAGDLDAAAWAQVVSVWQQRIAALEARPGVRCAFLFKNVGTLAGASIPHTHSQILGLDRIPPRLETERERARAAGSCPFCRTLEDADRQGRVVVAGTGHTALAPDPPKLPYETWILPHRCDEDFLQTDARALAATLQTLFARLRDVLGAPAFNLWLHRIPGERFHWHFELQPRTGQVAGLELGADMYMNSLPAAAAAARLRNG